MINLEYDHKAIVLSDACSEGMLDIVQAGFSDVVEIYGERTDTEAYVCEDNRAIWVAFRGTEVDDEFSVQDIKTDLSFRKTDYIGATGVHVGFLNAWVEVKKRVMEEVKWMRPNERKPVVITGHSLGGALACHAAFSMREMSPHLITFGQPRVGCNRFNRVLEEHCVSWHRWVYRGDAIAYVPPLALGYRHGGDLLYIGKRKVHVNPSVLFRGFQNGTRFVRRLLDHNKLNYRERISSLDAWRIKGD